MRDGRERGGKARKALPATTLGNIVMVEKVEVKMYREDGEREDCEVYRLARQRVAKA